MEELEDLDDSLKTFFKYVLPLKQLVLQNQLRKEVTEGMEAIKGKMKETDDGVKDIQGKMTDTNVGVKEIQGTMTDTNKGVKDIQRSVENIQDSIEDIGKKLNSNHNATLRLCAPPAPPEPIVGLAEPLRELKKKLFKEGVSVLVITASGGCGKTTLAKVLCRDQDVKGEFKDNIFFVTVSKTPNLKAIIRQLFLHQGYQVREFQSDEEAVNHLEHLLKRIGPKPILLVLDDVWPESESLLDKFNFQISDYKILVTSRCTFPRFDFTYKLDGLKYEDSISLFRHSAGLQDKTSYIVDEDVVDKVVNACKGFPLALTVVGRSLRGQPAAIWQKRVKKLSKGGSIFETNIDLLNHLKSSLVALDEKLKECYMDLGAFPEGQLIAATAIIDMWEELYELDDNGIASIHEFSALNLVDLVVTRKDSSEVEGYYNDHYVIQQDLLREMVNHLSRSESLDGTEQRRKRLVVEINGNEFPKWWGEQKQQPICALLLSISTDETFSSNWHNMQAPEVEALVLNLRTKNYTLPEFIKNMDKLKALIVTNYGFFPAEISNFSYLGCLSHLKRIRLEQVLIPSLNLNSVQLKNLQKISLPSCNMSWDFGNSAIQISDVLPSLVEINISYCNYLVALPPGLCDVVHLRKLYITYCHGLCTLPDGIGKLVNLEVLRLSSCVDLLGLPHTIGKLDKLSILDISDCRRIKKLPEQIGELQNLTKLFMTGCSICELPKSVTKLVNLKSMICDEAIATSPTS